MYLKFINVDKVRDFKTLFEKEKFIAESKLFCQEVFWNLILLIFQMGGNILLS